MGFWSGLGKGLLGAGGAIAAPFTGGASLATVIPAILGTVGAVASGASAGRAGGRAQEAGINANQDQIRLLAARMLEDAMQGRAGLDLQQRQFALQAPGQRAGNAARGDALAGLQDAGVSGPITHTRGQVPQITGGLRPSLLSANTRQLGQNMSRDALLQNMGGADSFQPLPPIDIPSITPTPQAGWFDKFLNILGGVGTGAGALSNALKPEEAPYNPYKVQIPKIPLPRTPWEEVTF